MTTVLIVEDDKNTLLAVTSMLEVTGHENVRSANNGVEGLEQLREAEVDLMFLDLMMPKLDGIGVLRELRNGQAPRPRHIVVMSAHANANEREGVKELGADQFLAKPFTLSQLERVLETAGLATSE